MGDLWIYVAIIIFSITASSLISSVKHRAKTRKRIKERWGKPIERRYTDDDWLDIKEYFENMRKFKKDSFFIDEITWNDLSMDKVFERINATETTVGEQYLYSLLRELVHDENELKARDKVIEYFSSHKEEREKMQFLLSKLGRAERIFISDYFFSNNKDNTSGVNWYKLLALIPIISGVIIFFNKAIGLTMLIISMAVNIAVYYYTKKRIYHKLEAFNYIASIVRFGDLIYKKRLDILKPYEEELKNALSKVSKIKDKFLLLNTAGSDIGIIIEYINAIFLISISNYKSLSRMLIINSEDFNKIFEIVGIVDSSISIASYRESLVYYVKPKLIGQKTKKDLSIVMSDLSHPLIEKSVPNSINIRDSILLTGSNASGKSTFLKTVALNVLFAQTIYTCLSKEFIIPHMNIFTSMALKDNLFNNESYYIAETKSLKRIISSVNEDVLTICFVDEILRGTNTVERIAASAEVLKYLTLNNCLCIAATHDVELTHILNDYFGNYHFREEIVDNQIFFDYKIHEGRATTQNAIKLLGILGYDNSIVESASNRATSFVREGVWAKC